MPSIERPSPQTIRDRTHPAANFIATKEKNAELAVETTGLFDAPLLHRFAGQAAGDGHEIVALASMGIDDTNNLRIGRNEADYQFRKGFARVAVERCQCSGKVTSGPSHDWLELKVAQSPK